MRSGIATFPLDYGRCPPWLFLRMKKLSRSIFSIITKEFGPEEVLKRLSDPAWFQALGSVLGFDWNSSGLTTTTLGAIKASIFEIQDEIGIYICGGKGKTSRKTPEEIKTYGVSRAFSFAPYLVFASKIAAKVDSALLQDGFQIYHHNFLFTKNGKWAVIQQGMNASSQMARRYHWIGDFKKDFIQEPHSGIATQEKVTPLNLTAKESDENRKISLEILQGNFRTAEKDLNLISQKIQDISRVKKVILPGDEVFPKEPEDISLFNFSLKNNSIKKNQFNTPYLKRTIFDLTTKGPKSFIDVLSQKGVGPKTIRALSLVGELIYGAKPSYEDPARYSFAHGGKDGVPFPVDLDIYDKTIDLIERGIKKSSLSLSEKNKAFLRMENSFLAKNSQKIICFFWKNLVKFVFKQSNNFEK